MVRRRHSSRRIVTLIDQRPVMTREPLDLILLLYADRADPIAKVLIEQTSRFSTPVLAMSMTQLVGEADVGAVWKWAGHAIHPSRTAVVNRLISIDPDATGSLSTRFQREQFWAWLAAELPRFAYASSLPSSISPAGGFGSLVDQWSDLLELVPGLRVPAHRTSGSQFDGLHGEIRMLDPVQLYNLGTPASVTSGRVPAGQLAYARPAGKLFHVAQVGRAFICPNAPPRMGPEQRAQVESFVRSIATVSTDRILEHTFFEGDSLPVFYSTCPVPVMTGRLPALSTCVVSGLQDDIKSRGERAAA